jgi:hypothetical protein
MASFDIDRLRTEQSKCQRPRPIHIYFLKIRSKPRISQAEQATVEIPDEGLAAQLTNAVCGVYWSELRSVHERANGKVWNQRVDYWIGFGQSA